MYNIRPIITTKLWDAKALAQAGVLTSDFFNLTEEVWVGVFSLHYIFTGSGHLTITYTVAPTADGTFLTPTGAADIGTALTAGSDLISFMPILSPFMKIVVTELNVSTITSLSLWIHRQ